MFFKMVKNIIRKSYTITAHPVVHYSFTSIGGKARGKIKSQAHSNATPTKANPIRVPEKLRYLINDASILLLQNSLSLRKMEKQSGREFQRLAAKGIKKLRYRSTFTLIWWME